jgi:cytochrome oxidase Cu insertion factor (SCO1/SenC/PrrC family)
MPGMGNGLTTNDPIIVSAFHTALLHQGLIVLLLVAIAGVSLNVLHPLQARRATAIGEGPRLTVRPDLPPEAPGRRILRISFGLLWVFDGILQGQSSMPLGMIPQVIKPSTAGSPSWVQHLVNDGATIWSYHPVQAAAATVWIQVGIGVWLLVARRGVWSRLGGVAGLGWGLVVWSFGESFGGIFAPGLTWLFGAPGGVVFYCAAGALLALPDRVWATARLGKIVLRLTGVFFLGMALLQAWPGRGSWSGTTRSGGRGVLVTMVREMAQTPQPAVLSSWVRSFESFDAAHGWGVNLFAVIALGAIGAAFLTARPRVARVGVVAALLVCLADWVLIEDFGFFGGVGTDPNSMVPMALLFVAGYVALTRPGVPADAAVVPIIPESAGGWAWRERLLTSPSDAFRLMAALVGVGIVLVGGVPMAVAAASPTADPLLATAVDGAPSPVHTAAPAFGLVNQHDVPVTLSSWRGKTIALTFLDPVCTSDCPIIAQEFRQADRMLGAGSKGVEFIAVDANPRYTSPDDLVAFDAQEGLAHVANWAYLTGSDAQLQRVWNSYGILVGYASGGAMIAHSDTAYVIDRRGQLRDVLDADPGGATAATESSFAVTLVDSIAGVEKGS